MIDQPRLLSFFSYYGGKYQTAPRYPEPQYRRIVEPFAGAAGYATRYHAHAVELYDANEKIVGIWQYLIHATEEELSALPVEIPTTVDDLSVCEEAKWLIGFWVNPGSNTPCHVPSSWYRDGQHQRTTWGPTIRERIATQVKWIRHWRVAQMSYESVPVIPETTWFVDPPYNSPQGSLYPSQVTDFSVLAAWCRNLPGQVMVCEQAGADWLPFWPVSWKNAGQRAHVGTVKEVLWCRTNQDHQTKGEGCQEQRLN